VAQDAADRIVTAARDAGEDLHHASRKARRRARRSRRRLNRQAHALERGTRSGARHHRGLFAAVLATSAGACAILARRRSHGPETPEEAGNR
jgi:hypothetical protein